MLWLDRLKVVMDGFEIRADLRIATGDLVAVIGPSGAGKSTLLQAIAGFLPLTEGRVVWDGADLAGVGPGKRPFSMIFQDNNLFPHLSVTQNVGLGIRPDLKLSKDEMSRVEATLARVGIAGMGERRPGALSGGQQGRVSLARMLVQDRPLVLLDEPFAALGPALRSEMLDLVAELAREQGKTVLMVTHDPRDARKIAGSAILVAEGVAHEPVATEALFADPPPALRAYLG